MQIRKLLIEVAQRQDRPGASLDLVQKEQRLARNNARPTSQLETGKNRSYVQVCTEVDVQVTPLLQVDLDHGTEGGGTNPVDQPRLANLPGSTHNEWFAA